MQANQVFSPTAFLGAAQILLGITRPWLIATCLLITAILLLPATAKLDTRYQVLLTYLPYGLGMLVILLGQQFVQGRIAMAGVNLLAGYAIVQTQLQAPLGQDDIRAYFTLLSIFWPLNFFIIYWLPERKLISPLGALLAIITSLEVASAYLLTHYISDYSLLLNQYFALQPFGQDAESVMNRWLLPALSSLILLLAGLVSGSYTQLNLPTNREVLM